MEITIFRKNEVLQDFFKNQKTFKIEKYNSISSLKNEEYGNFRELDETKCKLDLLDKNDERYRRAAAKYLHEYEIIKIICKRQVSSRAYFKLYEMIYLEPILSEKICNCFFICEAPGGFIECICDMRNKKNMATKYITISKNDTVIKYGNYLEENNIFYGDVTDINCINTIIETTKERFPNGLEIVTADGGFDVKIFIAQEILSSKLLLCEIYLGLKTQKVGGMFIIKFFDMFSHNSVIYYLLLCSFYNYVKIIKPKSSRNCNSERYLVCYGFKGVSSLVDDIYDIIKNFELTKNTITTIYPDFCFDLVHDIKKIKKFNNIILHQQIKTINESIKMVNTRDTYFQSLILGIFMDKTPNINKMYNILSFKNILHSRIKKCIEFLRIHSITINQIISF